MLTRNQVITALAVGYLAAIAGAQMTWPTALVEVFASERTPLIRPATATEVALVGSLSSIGSMLATPLFAYLFDRIGRKPTTMLSGAPLLVTWTVLAASSQVELVLAALFVSGLAAGGFMMSMVFVAEVAAADVRGGLTTVPVVGYSLGVLLSYALGGYLPYRVVIYIHLTLTVLFLAFVQLTRESPVFLLQRNDEKGALSALAFYRSVPEDDKALLEEFYDLKRSLTADEEDEGPTPAPVSPELEKLQHNEHFPPPHTAVKQLPARKILLRSRPAQRALALCLVLVSSSIFMGLVAVMVYADSMFQRAAPNIPSVVCNMMLAGSMLLSGVVGAAVSDRLGRKTLMLASSTVSGVCTLLLATQLQANWGPAWLGIVVILCFTFAYNVGAGIVPFVLVGEVFVPEVRALSSMVVLEWTGLINFVLLFVFGPLVQALTLHGVFYCFSAVCWSTVLYVQFFMPETKGLTPREIQPYFASRRERRLHRTATADVSAP